MSPLSYTGHPDHPPPKPDKEPKPSKPPMNGWECLSRVVYFICQAAIIIALIWKCA